VILEVVPLVRQLLPGLLQCSRPTVACLQTTRPKYLVFDNDSTRPACVVDFGAADRLLRVDRTLSELYHQMPGGVPRSLCCSPWQDGIYVHIQEGLPGVPWFRVSDGLTTAADWRRLLDRAVTAMLRLHLAIGEVPAWTGRVNVRAELAQQVRLLESRDISLSARALRRVEEWGGVFGGPDSWLGVWQHSDFSLNNLLVSTDSLAVIDFDEFGSTLIPLHDAFGLALSLPLSQEGRCPLSRIDCVSACVEKSLTDDAVAAEHLPGLLMHHLLWRINQCHGLERRAALRRTLLGWVEDLASAPETFLGNLT
jgi:Phosphotransferase enzyme family